MVLHLSIPSFRVQDLPFLPNLVENNVYTRERMEWNGMENGECGSTITNYGYEIEIEIP